MADLKKMAVFRRPETLRTWWQEQNKKIILNLPNSSFKTFETRSLLCKHSSDADSFPSPITGRTSEYLEIYVVVLTTLNIASFTNNTYM